jgi:hypothetical protein
MVLERGEDDFVAGPDELSTITVRHGIDRVGRAAGEDHFAVLAAGKTFAGASGVRARRKC